MNKTARVILITVASLFALGGVAAFAAPSIYKEVFASPPAEQPTLLGAAESELQQSASPSQSVEDYTGVWAIDHGSSAGYRVDEVLNGTQVTVTGRTESVTGTLNISQGVLQQAEITIDVASITTDNSARDRYFQSHVLRVDQFPTATFVLTEPVTADTRALVGEIVEQEVTGELTIAGVTQQVSFTVQFRVTSDFTEIVGEIPITFEDFSITAPSLGFVAVQPSGVIEFDLLAVQQAS